MTELKPDADRTFLKACRDSFDMGPERFKPTYAHYGDLLVTAEVFAASTPDPALLALVGELVGVGQKLADAEAEYRRCHDVFGDGHIQAGRAWDAMRRAGDEARATLTRAKETIDG